MSENGFKFDVQWHFSKKSEHWKIWSTLWNLDNVWNYSTSLERIRGSIIGRPKTRKFSEISEVGNCPEKVVTFL